MTAITLLPENDRTNGWSADLPPRRPKPPETLTKPLLHIHDTNETFVPKPRCPRQSGQTKRQLQRGF